MTTSTLMHGKKGLILGVANANSIATSIARTLHAHGAEMAFTYQGDQLKQRVTDVAGELGSDFVLPCDVTNADDMQSVFDAIAQKWGKLDFVVHSLAFSDKDELKGRFVDTTAENFAKTMHISCYSLVETARLAEPLMTDGGSIMTLSYGGAEYVMPNYNVMGIAKSGLEHAVKYLATDMGANNIRVNAISAGPMKTLAGAAITGARFTYKWQGEHAPLMRNMTPDDIGGTALYLASNLSNGTTGEIINVDGGYNKIGMVNLNTVEGDH